VRSPTISYDRAVPAAKNSDSRYPADSRSDVDASPRNALPVPPVRGPLIDALGPGGAAGRVGAVDAIVVVAFETDDEDEDEHAASNKTHAVTA
jgi:hypothetical protein